ncbi:MAG: hypothetical protein Q9213_001176 [Squamulea squamosa]
MELPKKVISRTQIAVPSKTLEQAQVVYKDSASLAPPLLPAQQDGQTGRDILPSTSNYSFFSLPPELRREIYEYLAPIRIHISSTLDDQERRHTKPWPLVRVSQQFRAEIRTVVYPHTPIDIHLSSYEMKMAFDIWITNLDEAVAASIKHLSINEFVDIDWKPDGPVLERPEERAERAERLRQEYGCEWPPESPEFCQLMEDHGPWEVLWLQWRPEGSNYMIEVLEDVLLDINEGNVKSGDFSAGLGKEGILALVRAYCHRRWDDGPDEDDEEYGDGEEDDAGDYQYEEGDSWDEQGEEILEQEGQVDQVEEPNNDA